MPVYMAEIDFVIWLSQPDIKTNTLSNRGAISHFIHKLFEKLEKLTFQPSLFLQQLRLLFVLQSDPDITNPDLTNPRYNEQIVISRRA